jgi:hypothetical protein
MTKLRFVSLSILLIGLSTKSLSNESGCETQEYKNTNFWEVLFGDSSSNGLINQGERNRTNEQYIENVTPDAKWRRDFTGALNCQNHFASDPSIELGTDYQAVGTDRPASAEVELQTVKGYTSINRSEP